MKPDWIYVKELTRLILGYLAIGIALPTLLVMVKPWLGLSQESGYIVVPILGSPVIFVMATIFFVMEVQKATWRKKARKQHKEEEMK